MSPTSPQVQSAALLWREPALRWIAAPLLLALAAFCWRLWPEWSGNPDLSHGFFTPLIFVLLLRESRQHGTPRWLPAGWPTTLTLGVGLTASLAMFGLAGLFAASLGWDHDLVHFLLGASLAALLGSGLVCLASMSCRIVPLNWISLTAIALWALSVPLPTGTYTRITLALQGLVSTGVIDSLQLLGIPARQHGNIIELTRTTVGVEEACSGIRSLLSCLYAGIFFAAWQVRPPLRRTFLIVTAPVLAILMNFLRSLGLTLLADAGVEIAGFWHDVTGFAILALTAVLLGWLALRLGASPPATSVPQPETPIVSDRTTVPSLRLWQTGLTFWLLLIGVFIYFGRPASPPSGPLAELDLLLPAASEGWEVRTDRGSREFFSVLHTERLIERNYTTHRHGRQVQVSVYLAHWLPGQAPVSLVAAHTPDACWPGAGWFPQANPEPQARLQLAGQPLPLAEHRIFKSASSGPQHVWFWHLHAGRAIDFEDPYSIPALLKLALRYGFRKDGEQYFIRISSNLPWADLASEPLLAEISRSLAPLGFTP